MRLFSRNSPVSSAVVLIGGLASAGVGAKLAVPLAHDLPVLTIAGLETGIGAFLVLSAGLPTLIKRRMAAVRTIKEFFRTYRRLLIVLTASAVVLNGAYIVGVTKVSLGTYLTFELGGLLLTTAIVEFVRSRNRLMIPPTIAALLGVIWYGEPFAVRADAGAYLIGIASGVAAGVCIALRLVLTQDIRSEAEAKAVKQLAGVLCAGPLILIAALTGDAGLGDIEFRHLVLLALCGFMLTGVLNMTEVMARKGLKTHVIAVITCANPFVGTGVDILVVHAAPVFEWAGFTPPEHVGLPGATQLWALVLVFFAALTATQAQHRTSRSRNLANKFRKTLWALDHARKRIADIQAGIKGADESSPDATRAVQKAREALGGADGAAEQAVEAVEQAAKKVEQAVEEAEEAMKVSKEGLKTPPNSA